MHLSMHTALRSASTPTVREQVAGAAQDNRLAPPSRLLPRGERACPQVLEPANMVHLERARCRAARLAGRTLKTCGQIVRALGEARADRDRIDLRPEPRPYFEMLHPPEQGDAGFAPDYMADAVVPKGLDPSLDGRGLHQQHLSVERVELRRTAALPLSGPAFVAIARRLCQAPIRRSQRLSRPLRRAFGCRV